MVASAETASPDIYDPDLYVDGPIHEIFAELRRTRPVYWQDMPDQPGYWAVLKHADVTHVARQPLVFSAEVGGVILEDQPPERLETSRNMLLMTDRVPRRVHHQQHVADDGPAAAHDPSQADGRELQAAGHR